MCNCSMSAQPSISKNVFRRYITALKWLGALWEFNLRPFRSPCPQATRSVRALCCFDLEWRQLAGLGGHTSPLRLWFWLQWPLLTVVFFTFPGLWWVWPTHWNKSACRSRRRLRLDQSFSCKKIFRPGGLWFCVSSPPGNFTQTWSFLHS